MSPPTRNVLLTALGLSLLFNVFVLVGFVRARSAAGHSQSPPLNGVVQRVTDELKLDDAQARTFAELRSSQREHAGVFDGGIVAVRQSLLAELRKDEPDVDRVRALVEQEADLYRKQRLAEAELFCRFAGMLNPQQRQMMLGRFGQRPPGREPPPVILHRFDANHNGSLDPDELEIAQRELEKHRRELINRGGRRGAPPPPPPPGAGPNAGGPPQGGPAGGPRPPLRPMWRRFDVNNDGQLDDAERIAMEEFRRQHPQPPPPEGAPPPPPPASGEPPADPSSRPGPTQAPGVSDQVTGKAGPDT